MTNGEPRKYLIFTPKHADSMMLYRNSNGPGWRDLDDFPQFIGESADRIKGFSVFEGEQGILEAEDCTDDNEIGWAGDEGATIGDEWWTGHVRPATVADLLEIFPELAAPTPTPSEVTPESQP